MDTLNFEANLDFNEFPAVSTEEWEQIIEKDLKGKNYKDVLKWNPENNLELLPFYRKEHLGKLAHPPKPVRASADWRIIQPVFVDDIKEANTTALQALENGASGLFFYGNAKSLKSDTDLALLLQDIQIDIISLKFGVSLYSEHLLSGLKKLTSHDSDTDLTIGIDPFAQAFRTGKLLSKDSIATLLNIPHTVEVDLSTYGNAGADLIQQNAFALAAGNELLGILGETTSLSFNFATANSYFPEIAKLRAFRLMWNQVLDSYEASTNNFSIYAETALWNKAQNDAHNNMLRATTEAMSAVLGGADALTVFPYNQHFEKPQEFSNRVARNVQLILQEEAYFDKVADPGAGSYYIETLTDKIAEESWKLFQDIESKGGFYECLKSGFIQDEVQHSRSQKIDAYKEKQKTLVGVNKYQPEDVIQNLKFKIQNDSSPWPDKNATQIKTIELLNMEVELQKGDA